jgi:hypothetical protein
VDVDSERLRLYQARQAALLAAEVAKGEKESFAPVLNARSTVLAAAVGSFIS